MAHILLVDDDATFRMMLKLKLEKMAHVVHEAANGLEAWTLFQGEPSDLIIMDLIMPEQEGLETIQKFRKQRVTAKILAISGGGRLDPRDLLKVATQLGADAVLAKPFTQEQLTEVLKKLLPIDQD
jgi:CheY-like chemotaxis protein